MNFSPRWLLTAVVLLSMACTKKIPLAGESPPTIALAKQFIGRVEGDLRKLWPAREQASWVNQNFITDDTEAIAARAEEATAEYITRAIHDAKPFYNLALPPELSRQLQLLRTSQLIPAPANAEDRHELAALQSSMTSIYGKGKYCSKQKKCQNIDELSQILRNSRNYDELVEAWSGWHSIAPPLREKYARYVELANRGAKEIGFADVGSLWRSTYDLKPEEFEADIERLWTEVKPIYQLLHCYVRSRLQSHYTKAKIADGAPIPAHLLGNMWAQDWQNIYDLIEPYKGEPGLDINKSLKAKKYDEIQLVQLGERFFSSLGFDALPKSFWQNSLFKRPRDREVLCHASAFDVNWNNDLRIKICIEPNEENLMIIHHELGHLYYFHQYYKLPMLFQNSANDGFHEGIGDAIALSLTPQYYKNIGLLDSVSNNKKTEINQQMKMALDKIAFLPFGLLIDKWRWDVFSGKITKQNYNQAWWNLRTKYQGLSAPTLRSEKDFDPGAKFHVPGSTPYMRYFLARIYQFQFHRALCKSAGYTGPLHSCSIYGNKAAGEKLRAMLALGASRPWPEALRELSGETTADASALLEYFAPLEAWLKENTSGLRCGW